MPRLPLLASALCLLLMLPTSCQRNHRSEARLARQQLAHAQALWLADSLPDNDTLLALPIRYYTQHGPDSLLAQAYYLQGELLRRHYYMLRAPMPTSKPLNSARTRGCCASASIWHRPK